MITNNMSVNGITCGKCVKLIESTLMSASLSLNDIEINKDTGFIQFSSLKTVSPQLLNSLFKEKGISKYSFSHTLKKNNKNIFTFIKRLYPLFLIFGYLLLTVIIISFISKDFSSLTLMSHYMGGFFIVFSFFKFLNLPGFVDAFQTYDPIAKNWKKYGYFYAFFELFAGLAYLVSPRSLTLNLLVICLLSFTSIGVWKAVRSKNTIQCACLGTVFNLPMTYVTIFENVVMILMSLFMILYI